jgi:microsomal epoxide hydrolase
MRVFLLLLLTAFAMTASAAAQERSVPVAPGVTLRVVELGRSSSYPTLVLIPGWGASSVIWRDQAERLSKRSKVVIVEPRSQGSSTMTAEGVTPRQRAKDLHEVLRRLGLANVVLVGWSQGVQDVAAYVDEFGTATLAGIVLVDATISGGAEAVERDPERAALLFKRLRIYVEHPKEYANGMLHSIILHPPGEERMTELASELLKTPTAIGVAMLVADLYGEDLTPAIPKFDKPTLVIASSASPELAQQRAMAAAFPDGKLEVIDDAGHAVFVDRPDRFEAAVARFLGALSTTRGGSD